MDKLNRLMLRDISKKVEELRRMVRIVEWLDEHDKLREEEEGRPCPF